MCNESGVLYKFHPSYSYDFNPNEKSFYYLKSRIEKNGKIVISFLFSFADFLKLTVVEISTGECAACHFHSCYIQVKHIWKIDLELNEG